MSALNICKRNLSLRVVTKGGTLTVFYHGKRILKWRLLSCVLRDFPSFDLLSSKA